MPQSTLMWQVSSLTMIRRAGLSCRGKYASLLILSALEELVSSCSSNMAGYAAKYFSWRCLLQVYANVEDNFCGRRGGGNFAEASLVCPRLGSSVGGGLVGGTSWRGTLPVLTFSQCIASSSSVVTSGMCGGYGAIDVLVPFLTSTIPRRLSLLYAL